MQVQMNGESIRLEGETRLSAFLAAHSPFGGEAVLCLIHGQLYRSVDEEDPLLRDGDELQIFPLIVGG